MFKFHVCQRFYKDNEAQICHDRNVPPILRVADSFYPHYCSLLVQTELAVSSVEYLQRFLKQVNVSVFSVTWEGSANFKSNMRIKMRENHLINPFPTRRHHICFDANCKRVFQNVLLFKCMPEHLLAPIDASLLWSWLVVFVLQLCCDSCFRDQN